MQATTDLLLRAGAPIQDLNAVRSPLSQVKGGGLRRRMGAARCVSLILSDVLGSDPAVIASGPTVPSSPDPGRALATLERWGVTDRVPPAVVAFLQAAGDGPVDVMADTSGDVFAVIADNDRLVDGTTESAVRRGLRPLVVWRRREGEARELAEQFVRELNTVPNGTDVVLGGGEATVTVRGDGVGGRNTEFALAAAIALDRSQGGWVIASLASDGEDGLVRGAGAIVDCHTVRRGATLGLDAPAALERNDSGGYFERSGDLLVPGPTGTNVNDLYLAVRSEG
jgi:glycerate-2-kinase